MRADTPKAARPKRAITATPMFALLISAVLHAQQAPVPGPSSESGTVSSTDPANLQEPEVEFVCPMDKEVRSKEPGFCPICGMKLVPGIPELLEYPLTMTTKPRAVKPGDPIEFTFRMADPKTQQQVHDFEIVHEKLYHLFVVSQDLSYFVHDHPTKLPDASFQINLRLPKAGLYRILSDIYPKGGTPQLIEKTVMVPGPGFELETARLEPDLTPKHAENLDVDLTLNPAQPVAGEKTLLFFHLTPNEGIELLLGAMGHMLAVSSDLIDMIHAHPSIVTDFTDANYKQLQFNLIFPRAGMYRVWVQFQRHGVVNTVAFNIPVGDQK